MVKHTQTIRPLLPTNYLSVLDHFVGLALKGTMFFESEKILSWKIFHLGKTSYEGEALRSIFTERV